MKGRRILAVAVAFALALIGCLAVVSYVRGADSRALAGREAVWVLITTKRVPAGTTGTQIRDGGYVERVAMPAAAVPQDAIDGIDSDLDALAVTADVQARQLLLRGMFDEATRISGGLVLPKGMLAVSVEMTAPGRVAGYVRPGSKVTVFDTFTVQDGKGRVPAGDGLASRHDYNHATRVLLPRVEVIAVGERGTADAATSVQSGDSGGVSGSGKDASSTKANASIMITVAVTQPDAERLVHAAQTGALYLALLDDGAKIEPGSGVDNDTLFP